MHHKLLPVFISLSIFTTFNSQAQSPAPDSTVVEASSNFDNDFKFEKVEIEATFPGGNNAWRNYLMKNLRADVPLKQKAPKGTYVVMVKFIVSRDGSISNIMAETKHGYGMEEEVIRIIKKGPRWLPARQGGRNVNAYRQQPVTFVLP